MKLDIPQLKADIADLEKRIREVKEPLRRTWTDVDAMSHNMALLCQLRKGMTDLMITRAWHRGRIHRQNAPEHVRDEAKDLGLTVHWDARKAAQRIYDRIAPRYAVEEAEAV